MNRLLVWCVPLIVLIFQTNSNNALAVTYPQKQQVLELIDQKMRIDGIPGVSFAAVQNGEISWSGALGLSDIESVTVASPESVYRSASLVKPITATAILQLQAASKIDLDVPVWRYCPAFSEKPDEVTIRQLLTHTSGVRSYSMPWSVFEAELFSTTRYDSVTDALSIFADDPLLHKPGSQYKYTSYGYNVLGCVIEAVSEMTYEEYIKRYILNPAGMHNTTVARSEQLISRRAGLYRRDSKGKLINERYVDLTNKIPSGGLLTTANDMARFAVAYMNGSLIAADTARQTYQPVQLGEAGVSYYGMGWDFNKVEPGRRGREMYHVGVTPGVTGIMYLYPETNSAFVLFGNLYNVADTEQLVQSVEKIVGFRQSSSQKILLGNRD